MCLFPKLIKNRKYVSNKKNGGNIPAVCDDRALYVPVGCQNCIECRKQKAKSWQVRLLEDIKTNRNGKFVALTFSDEAIAKLYEQFDLKGYELDNEAATRAVRLFLERWRKKYKKSLRHWFVTELGHNGTENIHLHGIVWSDHGLEELKSLWSYGHVWVGTFVNESTVNYIIKYVTKVDLDHPNYKSRILTSAGIGRNYVVSGDYKRNVFKGSQTVEYYKTRSGHKMSMPIYWRNKLYSDEERERLWLMKLDKQERFVLGQKVCVKDTDEHYDNAVKYARELNKRLGYGDDTKDYEQELYERNKRILMQKTRIEKAKVRERDSSPEGSYQKG